MTLLIGHKKSSAKSVHFTETLFFRLTLQLTDFLVRINGIYLCVVLVGHVCACVRACKRERGWISGEWRLICACTVLLRPCLSEYVGSIRYIKRL